MENLILKFFIFCAFLQTGLSQDTNTCFNEDAIEYMVKGETTLLTPDGEQQVSLHGLVSVTAGDRIMMSILRLQVFNADGKELVNPDGLDKAVVFDREDRPLLNNMAAEEGETLTSIHIKKAIINMLPTQVGQSRTHSQIQDMFHLLEEGKHKIILNDDNKDVILVLGNTGAGKSTFTQWITRSSNKLSSIELASGDFMIQDDQNKISNETIESKTTFPDLVIDTETNTAYYDLPGFSDTRSSSNDLASSYFTTTIIEHAKGVKLVFVVNYSSVRRGVDRKDFILLLQHVTELVKSLNKYKYSIALIVTKVENQYKRGLLVPDERVINGIADFLKEVRGVLIKRQMTEADKLPVHKLVFFRRAIGLIDIILSKDNDTYSKIKLFRRPDDSGSLDEMDILNKERDDARSLLNEGMKFTEVDVKDFGRTISDSSRNEISDLVENVEKNILRSICKIASHIKSYFVDAADNINSELSFIDMNNISISDTKLSNAQKLFENFMQKSNFIEELVLNITDVQTLETVPKLIIDFISNFNVTMSEGLLSSMSNEGQYLKFLISSTDKEINTRIGTLAWASDFQTIQTDLIRYQTNASIRLTDISQQLEKIIVNTIQNITQELQHKYYYIEENTPDIFEVYEKMVNRCALLSLAIEDGAYNDTKSYEVNDNNMEGFISRIKTIASFENISIDNDLKVVIMKYKKYYVTLNKNLKNVSKYINDTIAWYKFLNDLFISLSRYDVQSTTTKCFSISESISYLDEGKVVNDTAINQFLNICLSSAYNEIYPSVQDIKLDRAKLWHLKTLLSLLLAGPTHTCQEDGKIIIKGLHITTSDVMNKACPGTVNVMEIFALDTIFIDHDINERGKQIQLAIVAPKWIVTGRHNIILDGLAGKSHVPYKASDGHYPDVNGEHGMPGLPGGTGGSFLGIGHTFVNGKSLTISSNGGMGGDGQDGGNGGRGKDGVIPNVRDPQQYLKNKGIYYSGSKYSCYFFGCTYYPVYEDMCTNGGDFGIAGEGGYGGYPGKVSIISTSTNDLDILIEQYPGPNGEIGTNGRSGQPGRPGKKVVVDWKWIKFWDTTSAEVTESFWCYKGNDLRWPNENNNLIEQPNAPVPVDESVVLEDYEEYVKDSGSVIETLTKRFIASYKNVLNITTTSTTTTTTSTTTTISSSEEFLSTTETSLDTSDVLIFDDATS